MRNAPWNTDDREVLREKWRLVSTTASVCEQLLRQVETLRIRVDYVVEDSDEHGTLAVEAREMFIAVGKQLSESGLTMEDWHWFVENKLPDEPEHWEELAEHWQQATELRDVFRCLENFIRAIATAKQRFAEAVKLSLNAWEEPDPPSPSWYQRVDGGVYIHDKFVELQGTDADVLEYLCNRTNCNSTYHDLATVKERWERGLDSGHDKSISSIESNIRTSLSKINKALQQWFNLEEGQTPVKQPERGAGWKLDKDMLR